jgi:hypothetical protein
MPTDDDSSLPSCPLLRIAFLAYPLFRSDAFFMSRGDGPRGQSEGIVYPSCIRQRAISWIGSPEKGLVIRIQTFARLGNNFFQLVRAYLSARILLFPEIHVDTGFLFINQTIKLPYEILLIPVHDQVCDRPECRTTTFWYEFDCLDELDPLFFFQEIRDILVANLFPKPAEVTDDTLAVHLRGGDEARLRTRSADQNQQYGPPPCYYFVSVIRQFNDSLLLTDGMSEDGRWNPCHNLILQAGAKATEGDLRRDFARMIWSRYFVLSVSTLSYAALWMSPEEKTFWTFNNFFQIRDVAPAHPLGSFKYVGDHWNCIASRDYTAAVLQSWGATDEQNARLVTDKCTWTDVPGIPEDTWPLRHVRHVF